MKIQHEQKFVTLYTFIGLFVNFLKSGESENVEEFLNSICVTRV